MQIIWIILLILFSHFIGDFVMQSHWMATNKSRSQYALTTHVLVYTLTLMIFTAPLIQLAGVDRTDWLIFIVANGLAHYETDLITSKITSRLWMQNKMHWFFCVIGLDQLLHQTFLIFSVAAVLLDGSPLSRLLNT